MRVAAATAPQVRTFAFLPIARAARAQEEPPCEDLIRRQAAVPIEASAAFLAQAIAQELYPEPLPLGFSLAAVYRRQPRAAFEGLNFRTIA
jgi:hypothetical protein